MSTGKPKFHVWVIKCLCSCSPFIHKLYSDGTDISWLSEMKCPEIRVNAICHKSHKLTIWHSIEMCIGISQWRGHTFVTQLHFLDVHKNTIELRWSQFFKFKSSFPKITCLRGFIIRNHTNHHYTHRMVFGLLLRGCRSRSKGPCHMEASL